MSEALCIMYGPLFRPLPTQRGGRVRGLCLSCRRHTIRCPPAPVGPSHHVRIQWCGPACIHYIIICSLHIHSPLLLPLLLHIHPLHPVTSSHTPRRFTSWPLTPPPRSDSVRSTLHNVWPPSDPSQPNEVGVYVVYNVCHVAGTPSDAHRPP